MEKELKVLAVGDPAVYAYTDPRFSIIETFNREHNANIQFSIIPWNDYYNMMIKTFEGEYDYDIVMVAGHLWLKDFVSKNYLAEVSIPQDEQYDADDIIDCIKNELLIDGKPYLYPSFSDGHILVYRKSVVEKQLGRTLPSVVSTDTIISLATKCYETWGMKGIALKAHPSEIFLDFLPYLRNEGLEAFDQVSHVPLINHPLAQKALDKYLLLKAFSFDDTNTYGNDEVREAFQQKKCALAVTWGGQLGFVLDERCKEPEDVGFAAIQTAWNVTWSFAINQRSSNKMLANTFLAYLSSKEIDRIVGGYAGSPVRRSTYIADVEKYPWYKTHRQLIETYAKPLPQMLNAGDKLAPLYEEISRAFSGEISSLVALEEAEKRILEIDSRRS